jgi:predicted 2-oxoglutarate/Fe(II)-dependent dioxygenase YbiX
VLTSSAAEPTAVDLGSDIFLVENLLDLSLCAHIIQIAECCQFTAAGIEVDRVAQDIRSNDLLYLDGPGPLLRSTNRLLLEKVAWVQQFLVQIYGVGFPHAETCSILRYGPGQYYKRHVDNLLLSGRLDEAAKGVPTRDVSIIGYLNQDCEGGETYLDRQGIKVKPQAGSVLVFPSYYTYPHQSLPVTAGVKYAFTTWLFH